MYIDIHVVFMYNEIRSISDTVDVLYLPRICCHSAPVVYGEQDGRGGDYNQPLPVCPGLVPSSVSAELDLQILF